MPLDVSHELIFGHQGNARVAASVTLAGMVAVLLGGVFMTIGAPVKQGPGPARGSIGGAPATVRVIGIAPRESGPCEQQVWPNIDQRCLVRTQAKTIAGAKSPAVPDDKLTPLTAASVNHPSPPQDATAPQAATQPPPVRQSARNETAPPDETVGGFRREFRTDDVDDPDVAADLPPERPVEPPRRRDNRHIRFHLNFGGFRF
jgi:hypothetical protein